MKTLIRIMAPLLVLAAPLAAQDMGAGRANLGFSIGNDETKSITDKTLAGFTAGFGWTFATSDNMGLRPHLDLISLQGKDGSGISSGQMHTALGLDVVRKLGGNWRLYGGLMAIKWRQDESKATLRFFNNIPMNSTDKGGDNRPTTNAKFGARLGAELNFNRNLGMDICYTQAEFNKRYNPGWLTVGMTFTF